MKMNYFRFLYGETKGCFMHYGEWKDDSTEESFTFLYLRGADELVSQEESEHMLFLCPKRVDLVILGRSDKRTLEAWRALGTVLLADTLVCSMDMESDWQSRVSGAKHVVNLAGENAGIYRREASGWNFFIKSYENGQVVVMHGPGPEEKKDSRLKLEDCVMNVKALTEDRRCHCQENPDGYGCALGCVLHQDYDVCKYQGETEYPGYRTGTLLLTGMESKETLEAIKKDKQICNWETRFYALPQRNGSTLPNQAEDAAYLSLVEGQEDGQCKKYFVGTKADMEDEFLGNLVREGFYSVPVVVTQKQGLCCSGFLKYSDK